MNLHKCSYIYIYIWVCVCLVWFVGFHGISNFVGYLTPNTFLCKLSVLFKTIQFSISTQFVKNISISNYSSSYM